MKSDTPSFPWSSLLSWYALHGRHDLPWRDYHHDEKYLGYRTWVSEIFLQQTQVSRVMGYFERVIERFPTLESLAHTDYETFFPYYQGLGYYSRARNMLRTAHIVEQEYSSLFPREIEKLKILPGVGEYTARAILAFGYGESYLAWDTNLEKVFARYYHGSRVEKLRKEEKDEIEKDFREFILGHPEKVRSVNNALMDFAATVDLKNPSSIDWESYPIRSGVFYETRGSEEPREMKKSVSFPIPDATVMVVLHKDHKVYYSLEVSSYSPFILPPSLTRETRTYVQEYFREKYGLELSVRPAHKKWISEDGKPYVMVNAQIQTGKYDFREYTKSETQLILRSL